ncbi:MipA/OmpV family protein [Novosphingobium sp.]|uniref:MipA/OmpV family protein n=1 Tax=Novosphingobium sp. TaxID=1874826 RepID=UPI0025D4E25F|nr:MipA/OmpV family protein [Novosphingobium sp.]
MGNSWAFVRLAIAGCALTAAGTARASEHADNRFTVGVGGIVAPDYEGSNDYVIRPALGALARIHGHNIAFKGTSLSIDLVPEYRDQKFKIVVAPFANLNFDRSDKPRDPVVGLVRKRKVALEAGATVGLTWNGVVTSKYDTLTIQVSASHDVGNVSKSFIITPTAQYLTPLSEKTVVGMSLSADVVGGRYARYYFGVGPNASAASGLAQFRPSGGLKSATAGLMGAHALGHDLNHGFALGALFSYERLFGDFARSPLVATRGSRSQLVGSIGLGYTF